MRACIDTFSKYYTDNTASRRLVFVAALGSCKVQMKVGSKKYDLSVTTLQVSPCPVLLGFALCVRDFRT